MKQRAASRLLLRVFGLSLLIIAAGWLLAGPLRMQAQAQQDRDDDQKVEAEADEDIEARERWFISQRAYPFDAIPPDARRLAWEASAALRAEAAPAAPMATEPQWRSIGPQPSADPSPNFRWSTSGRVSTIAVSPANSQIVLVGGAAGGIWRSSDGGAHFSPTTDNQVDAAVGSIAFAPGSPTIVYAGMGDPFGYLGSGVLKSTDAGVSWTRVSNSTLPAGQTAKIAIDPANANRLYVAQSGSGFFYSTDGGVNWTKTFNGAARDLVISPANSQTLYVGVSYMYDCCNQAPGIFKSTNGGQAWTRVYTTPFDNNAADNLQLAVTPASPQNVYAFTGGPIAGVMNIRVLVSTDNGQTWANKGDGGIHPVQFWYNCYIAVDATTANTIYAATTMLYKSTDGGSNWTNLTNGYAPGPYRAHVDQHAFAFSPANHNEFYIGNDGGVWKTSDGGPTMQSLNDTLSLTQFYGLTLHPTNPLITYAGTQDNSLQGRFSTALKWDTLPSMGEGKDLVIDAVDPTITYFSDIRCLIARNTNNGHTFDAQIGSNQIFGEPDSAPRVNWTAPLAGNGRDSTIYFGTWRLFKSTNRGTTWTKPGGDTDLTKGPAAAGGADVLSAIQVAPSNASVIYTGSAQGRAMVSTNGGVAWTEITAGLPDRYITQIVASTGDAALAYLVVSGYGSGHVFKTTNYGASWTNISGNLPDAPTNALLIDPLDPSTLIVGTDIGAYRSTVGGTTWTSFNNGMPPAAVTGLSSQPTGLIQLSTYGRGVFELDRNGVTLLFVANTNDSGTGSLRQAILNANASAGLDEIRFSIPGAGLHTISPTTDLPNITGPVIIDATTQPGYAGTPVIELSGGGVRAIGLYVGGGASTIKGLVVNGFTNSGIRFASSNNTIQGNYIGTNAAGTAAVANANGVNNDSGANNLIGGTTAAARNIISGNASTGVFINTAAASTTVQGNYIGTNAAGTAAIANNGGVQIYSANNTVGGTASGAGNLISGNTNSGVYISSSSATGNQVLGNRIGTNAGGTAALANGGGVVVIGAPNNSIGGAAAGAGNVISGNVGYGLFIVNGGNFTQVKGNLIGTDVSGTAAVGNSADGVIIQDSTDCTVGGATLAERNVISANQLGVRLIFANAIRNLVAGNYIGTDASGTLALGNTTHGVIVTQGASSNAIRDNLAIANNGGNGITIISGTENLILRNSIFANGGLGIDLGGDGVTANDAGDPDTGPNNLQNFPVLTSAVTSGANTTIQGTINSTASATLLLNFFASPSCDAAGYGEGKTYLGALQVTTNTSGNATFTNTYSVSVPAGQVITATAMTSSGSTSEFSACLAVTSNCTYPLTPTSQTFSAQGGNGSINISANVGCIWNVTSSAGWITVTSPTSSSGTGTITYSVSQNINVNSRTGTITVANQTFMVTQSGIPAVGLSYSKTSIDSDSKADLGFYRNGLWGFLKSTANYSTNTPMFFSWGAAGKQPISADFDGDGKADIGYMDPPANGQSAAYAILLSSRNYSFATGQPLFAPAGFPSIGDTPVFGDIDGDGKADPGIWRATQGVWIIPKSSSNYTQYVFAQWGQLGDVPVIADFDHDGKADLGFYRNGLWGVLKSSANYSTNSPIFFSWGAAGKQPIVGDFDGDGQADIGYMDPPANGQSAAYAILLSSRNYSFATGQPLFVSAGFPSIGDTPIVADFDGDGKDDPGIWRESQGVWIVPLSGTGYTTYIFSQWGGPRDIAIPNTSGKH